ncbi:MAG TPA: hypothetical protein VHN39_08850, partial [Phenylobacterium sp.]|nr:hypothetical protein [Phenylobacterium sp.]
MTLKTLSAGAATALALAALASGAQATVYNLALTGVVAHGTASFYSSPYKFEIFTLDLGLGGAQPFTLQVGDEVRATVTLDTPLVVPQSGLDVVWTKLTNTDGIGAPVDATTGLTGIGDLSGGTLGAGTGPLSGGCGNCLSNFILEHNGFSFDTFFSDVTVSALAAPYEVNN